MSNNIQPNSPQWQQARLSKFSASSIHKLFTAKNEIANNDTSRGYILEKAIESILGYQLVDLSNNFDIQRGNELEPFARQLFTQRKALEFIDVTDSIYFEIDEYSCATPDGLVGDDAVVDYKCPRELNFFKVLDSVKMDNNYYLQLQMQMLATNRSRGILFNYCQIKGQEYGFELVVNRDESIIAKIKEAIKLAANERDRKIAELRTRLEIIL